MTTPAELCFAVLESFSGPYYTAQTETQRARVVAEAARFVAPMVKEMERAAAIKAAMNPT